jgi:hypothetical protein
MLYDEVCEQSDEEFNFSSMDERDIPDEEVPDPLGHIGRQFDF